MMFIGLNIVCFRRRVLITSVCYHVGFADIPLEIILTVAAGILVLMFVCIIALCVRWKLKGQHDVNNQAIYNQSTVSSSGGYATTKPHTRSSWTCTYKAGHQHQGDTHIWETPLPEPSADEYTLPTSMRPVHTKTPVPNAILDSMEYTVPISSSDTPHSHLPSTAEYTAPVKMTDQRDNAAAIPLPESNTNDKLPSGTNYSQVNYYYYDPSTRGNSTYLQPSQVQDKDSPDIQNRPPESYHDNPGDTGTVQDAKECAYRTLIRLDNSPK